MNASNRKLKPFQRGYYIGSQLKTGVQIGYDYLSIDHSENKIVLKCRHTIFGTPNFVQHSTFTLDSTWLPLKLQVVANDESAVVDFLEEKTNILLCKQKKQQKTSFSVGRQRAYFLLNGALYTPLLVVKRLDFDITAPQYFDLIPNGICEVKQIDTIVEDSQPSRLLQMRISIDGIQDLVELKVNAIGDLTEYKTQNMGLLVKVEESLEHAKKQ